MSWSDYIFKAAKGWEGDEPFWVWQIQSIKTPDGFHRVKLYMVVDARPQTFGVRLAEEKPEGLKGAGSLQGMMRKHAKAPAVGQPSLEGQHIWLPLYTEMGAPPAFWLVLAKKKPPELAFLTADGDCLLKRGHAGTFTKRHRYDLSHPGEETSGLGAALTAEALGTPAPSSAEEKTRTDEGQTLLPSYQRGARDKIARRLKTVRKSLANAEQAIPSQDDMQTAERDARLLQQFLYKVKEGDFELRLAPEETGLHEAVEITLDPDKSPGRNLEDKFVAVKKAAKARATGLSRLSSIQDNMRTLSDDLAKLRGDPLSEHDVQVILVRHKIAGANLPMRAKSSAPVASPYRRYRFPEGYDALVGKSAKDNDEMTKQAKANDLWLHIVGPPGSHVILQTGGRGEPPPAVVKKAAVLAIHYSKFRGDQAGEVYVTAKHNLKKKKGLPPGKWIIEHAETMFVRYSDQDLKAALDCQVD